MMAHALSTSLSNWIFLSTVVGIPAFAMIKRVDLFDSFTQGAKDGFALSVKIIPALVAILVAISMFRAAGGFDLISHVLKPILASFNIPKDIVPLALIRPFSGSASNGLLANIAHQYGGDSLIAHMAAVMVGSTETTFYVVAVYFACVAIKRSRYAIASGLIADAAGIIAAIVVTKLFY